MLKKIFKTNRFKNIKWFHTLHSEHSRYFGIKRKLVQLTYQKCDFIIGVNKEISHKWSKFLMNKNIKTILNGISKKDYSIIYKSKKDPNNVQILWVGRMEYIKNPFLIIKSLYYLKSIKTINLIIIGNGSLLKEVKSQINAFKNKHIMPNINVELHSKMTRKEVLNEFGKSNIYVNTSFSEAFCTTALEAFVNPDCYLLLPNIRTMKALYSYDRVTFYKKMHIFNLQKKLIF